ncbi:MAG TPA: hypothetical protein VHL78_05440 [Actinomycetota bacterium]|nr:hypothetical protein [Actinomycetota bacterium]
MFARAAVALVLVAAAIPLATAAEPSPRSAPDRRASIPLRGRLSPAELRQEKLAARRRAPAARPAARAAVPVEELEFEALSGTIAPADPTGAAGPAHVLTAVNVHYALWDKATGAQVLPTAELESLFANLPPFVFDPKVVYDPYHDAYVLVFLAVNDATKVSRILIVSMPAATVDDPTTWCRRNLDGDQVVGGARLWADYPAVGFDAKRLYVSTNQFTFPPFRFRYAQVLAMPKSRLFDCTKTPGIRVFAQEQTRDPQGFKGFTIQPAVTISDGAPSTEFLLSFQDVDCGGTCGNRVVVWRIKTSGGKLKLTKRSVKVGKQRLAPYGTQEGGSTTCAGSADTCWDTGDLRLIGAFYDADRQMLLAGHAVRRDVATGDGYIESVIRWYDVDPSPFKAPSLDRKGVIGASQRDAGWPMPATDGQGTAFFTYSRAGAPGAGEFLSAYVATVPPGSTAAQVALLRSGEATYDAIPGPDRWGDFNGINRDPVDPADVWTVNQVAVGTFAWRQVVNRVSDV